MSYQIIFVLNFFVIFFLMKMTGWFLAFDPRPRLWRFLFTTPLLSARTYVRNVFPKDSLRIILLKLLLSVTYIGLIIWLAQNFLLPLNYFKIVLIAPMIYLFTEFMGAFGQFLFYPASSGVAPIHFHPLKSRSLSEFWGKRWNFWVRDWLRDVSQFQRRRPVKKIIVTFLVSGFFHELLVNLPYFLYFRINHFGNMTLYFACQGLGLWLERRYLSGAPSMVRIFFMWMVVLLPAPLFLDKPLLRFFGIING